MQLHQIYTNCTESAEFREIRQARRPYITKPHISQPWTQLWLAAWHGTLDGVACDAPPYYTSCQSQRQAVAGVKPQSGGLRGGGNRQVFCYIVHAQTCTAPVFHATGWGGTLQRRNTPSRSFCPHLTWQTSTRSACMPPICDGATAARSYGLLPSWCEDAARRLCQSFASTHIHSTKRCCPRARGAAGNAVWRPGAGRLRGHRRGSGGARLLWGSVVSLAVLQTQRRGRPRRVLDCLALDPGLHGAAAAVALQQATGRAIHGVLQRCLCAQAMLVLPRNV